MITIKDLVQTIEHEPYEIVMLKHARDGIYDVAIFPFQEIENNPGLLDCHVYKICKQYDHNVDYVGNVWIISPSYPLPIHTEEQQARRVAFRLTRKDK